MPGEARSTSRSPWEEPPVQGFFDFVKSLGAARLAAMAAVTLSLIGFFSFLIIRMTTPQMVPLFTDLSLDEIARLETLQGAEINQAKIVLANEITGLVRGEGAARAAEATAAATFAGGGLGEDLPVLDVPSEGIRLGAACTALGFTASNGEAKRKIAEGAVRIDDEPMTDPAFLVTVAPGHERKLSLGRKRHAILRGS